MTEVHAQGTGWQSPDWHRIPFTDAFRISGDAPVATISARLTLKAWNLLREEHPLAIGHVQQEGDQYRMQVPVAGFQGIGRFVLGLPEEVTIEGPDDFIAWLEVQCTRRNFRAAQNSGAY